MTTKNAGLVIEEIAWHRNGISGLGFYVVKFLDPEEECRLLAVVFPLDVRAPGNGDGITWDGRVAVFGRQLLAQDVIAFGKNSWRGDRYEGALRRAIANYDWPADPEER